MHVISVKALKQFWAAHPMAETGLKYWYKIASNSQWKHIEDVRRSFPHADSVGHLTVFNIGGNKYRLIAKIVFSKGENSIGKIYIRSVLTHLEYDKGNWKKDSWF
jgi:mRNA interferase HigB